MSRCVDLKCEAAGMPHSHEPGDGGFTIHLTPRFMIRLGAIAQQMADAGVPGAEKAAEDVRAALRKVGR